MNLAQALRSGMVYARADLELGSIYGDIDAMHYSDNIWPL